MPDINLLSDTTTPEPEQGKPREVHRPQPYTDPGSQRAPVEKPNVPSTFAQRLRGLFAPKLPKAPKPPKRPEALQPILKSVAPDEPAQITPPLNAGTPSPSPLPRPTVNGTPVAPLPRRLTRFRHSAPGEPGEEQESFGVNLLPDELAGRVNTRESLLVFGGVLLFSVLIVGIFYVALTIYESSITRRTQETRTQRLTVDTSINALRSEQRDSIAFKERTDTLMALLDQHIVWSKFFATFERYVDRDVFFAGAFPGDAKGNISLQGQARDFTAVARQMVIFRDASEFVTKADITAATAVDGDNGQVVSFGVQLAVNPSVFTETAEEFRARRGSTETQAETATDAFLEPVLP